MKWLLLFFAVCNFLSFFWSVIGVFKKNSDQDVFRYRLLQLNSLLLWITSCYQIFSLEEPDLLPFTLMILVQIICLVAFWSQSAIVKRNSFTIAFSKDLPQRLITEGLYKRVRHPFYMIYLFCYFSIALGTQSILLAGLSASILAIYFVAAKGEELKFLSSPLSEEYKAYRTKTWMFFPKFF